MRATDPVRYALSYLSLGTRTRFVPSGKQDNGQMLVVLCNPSATFLPGRRMRKLAHLATILVKYFLVVPSVGMAHNEAYRCVGKLALNLLLTCS